MFKPFSADDLPCDTLTKDDYADIERGCTHLESAFEEFQEKAEKLGVASLSWDDRRCFQASCRFVVTKKKSESEFGPNDKNMWPRAAAIWAYEIMRAGPILAPCSPKDAPEVKQYSSRANAEFAIYFSSHWMRVPISSDHYPKPALDSLKNALQFHNGCRHTLTFGYLMLDAMHRHPTVARAG